MLFWAGRCVAGKATSLLGPANADAQNARASTMLMHRTGHPHTRLNLLCVFMP